MFVLTLFDLNWESSRLYRLWSRGHDTGVIIIAALDVRLNAALVVLWLLESAASADVLSEVWS